MAVIKFKRNSQKEQLLEIIKDFDFDKGGVVLYLDSDVEQMDSEFQIVSTYGGYGIKEAFAFDNVATYVKSMVFDVMEEE